MSASGFRVVLRSLRYPREFRGHEGSLVCAQAHVSLPKFYLNTGRLCSAGSGCRARSPPSSLVCSHPTPHAASARLRSALGRALPHRANVGSVPRGVTATGPAVGPFAADGASEWVTGSPSPGSYDWTVRGLPGYRAVFFGRATVVHPAGPPSARPSASGSAAFRVAEPLSIRDEHFGAAFLRPTRSPDYASTAPSRGRLQVWLPACWLHFDWVGIAPTRRLIKVSVYIR